MNHLYVGMCKMSRCQWQTFNRIFKLPGICMKDQEELRKILYLVLFNIFIISLDQNQHMLIKIP